ncbi:MAG: CobW-like GTP-binding protein [Roseburia sp.]|nr:CobW-like GTP-binding protein [Anaeroplasma bactoclasticum]MCM1195754.1 CobW-like GTP-binding protein [Roseburia sp.]MCM1556979.1 CobW-like GTP-binding protein [Anaeroplasma bactoclasticum]
MVEVPIFIVNGLIESGKTTLIKEIIENNVSYQAGSTVLVVCEEGEVEYEDSWLKEYEVSIVRTQKEADLNANLFFSIDEKYKPVQIVLEYNSFYNVDNLEFPEYMPVYQQVTLIDASTFGLYFNNMRQVFNNLVKLSSLIIFNRCDGLSDLGNYRRQIRALNQECQIGFEGKNGQLTSMLDEDLPYDITKDTILLEDSDYPTWYIDVFDNYEKYMEKTIKFKTFVRDILEDSIVVGRNVMTCCENDIQFLGYEVKDVSELVAIGDCIFLECIVTHEYSNIAEEEVVMLHAKKVSKLPKEEDTVLSF